jgi:hypothetical protein
MSEAPDRDLEDEVRALLRPARDPLDPPGEVKARALRRLSLALPLLGGGGASAPRPPGDDGGPPGVANGLRRALAARVPAWSLVASFVAGAAFTKVATQSQVDRLPPPIASAVTTAALPPVEALPIPMPLPSVRPVPVPVLAPPSTPPVRAATSVASGRSGSDGLEAERALLDVARTALGRGDGANALRAAEEHGRRFPRGILAEEREAMSIQALRLLHRDDDAQARLERFRGRFPTSLIRPALEAADGGTP